MIVTAVFVVGALVVMFAEKKARRPKTIRLIKKVQDL